MEGWIKLHRKFLEWEWFEDEKMVKLFIYLLLSVNFEDKKWRGIDVKRGQMITGRKALSEKTRMSEQTIRTCIDHLKSTNEITIKATNQFSVLTLINYEAYQDRLPETNQQTNQPLTNEQPATNQRVTTTKERKKEKKDKNVRANEFKIELLTFQDKYGVDLLKDFFNYWTEANKSGRMRFEMEKTWEMVRRLNTWFRRSKSDKSNPRENTVTSVKTNLWQG